MLLAENIINNTITKQAIFVLPETIKDDPEKDKALFEQIDSMDAIALYRDFCRSKRIPKGRNHFFLTEDQDFNVEMAIKVIKKHNKSQWRKQSKIKVFVRTEMENIGHLFPASEKVEVNVFNQSDLTARKFVAEHPMIDIVPAEKKRDLKVEHHFNILVLGFGWTGREMLNKTICDSQFVGSTFSATIFDKDFCEKQGEYPLLYDECIKEYNLIFENDKALCTIGNCKFYSWLNENLTKFDRIFVTLGDDNQNIETGISISKLFMKQGFDYSENKVFVHVKDAEKYCYCKEQKNKETRLPLTFFGKLDEIYTMDMVVNEQMDVVAKAVNYVYCNQIEKTGDNNIYMYPTEKTINDIAIKMPDAEKLWSENLSVLDRDSNRAVASNIENIIKLCGGDDMFNKTISDNSKLDLLAENEHLRWNAFHLTQGIRHWDDIPTGHKTKAKLFRNNDKKDILLKHACICPFNQLQSVADKVNENLINDKESKSSDGKIHLVNYIIVDRMITRHFMLFKKLIDNENI